MELLQLERFEAQPFNCSCPVDQQSTYTLDRSHRLLTIGTQVLQVIYCSINNLKSLKERRNGNIDDFESRLPQTIWQNRTPPFESVESKKFVGEYRNTEAGTNDNVLITGTRVKRDRVETRN